jgi:hypothetical protein
MRRLLKTLLIGVAAIALGWLLPATQHASVLAR